MSDKVIDLFERKSDHYISLVPFRPGSNILFHTNDVEVSAVNFISEYQGFGHGIQYGKRMVFALGEALGLSRYLLEHNMLKVENFDWHDGQEVENLYLLSPTISDVRCSNMIYNTFKDKDFSLEDTIKIAFENYVEMFVKYFNHEQDFIKFKSREDALKMAQDSRRDDLVNAIAQSCDETVKLKFTGAKSYINQWNIDLITYQPKIKIVK